MKKILLILLILYSCSSISNKIDTARYEEGKEQYALIKHKSEMPKYGICWKDAMIKIQSGCKHLTDGVQSHLALAYLNCFLAIQGRETYKCGSEESIKDCTTNMVDADRSSYTTMFTHTQNICYFLQAQIWHEEMDFTIDRLANSSSRVGQQLEESFSIQMNMIHQQNESLKNQQKIINQALDLRVLINDVFDRVAKLQSLVLGEFSGFYSIIYYMFSIILCYLLTSTPRTSGARFWLFAVMTVNMLLEQIIILYTPDIFITDLPLFKDEEELVFFTQRFLRKISTLVGFLILVIMAYKYEDTNMINSQLLVEIRKQNSDIKQLFLGSHSPSVNVISTELPLDYTEYKQLRAVSADSTTPDNNASTDVSGYSSDDDDDASSINRSDKTFSLNHDADVDTSNCESDSFVSVTTDELLMAKHSDLKNSTTPVRQLTNQLSSWINTGFYNFSSDGGRPCPSTSTSNTSLKPTPRYNLRPRRGGFNNSLITSESSTSFHKTVKHLEKLARKNSRLSKAMIRRKQLNKFSDDE